MIAVSAPGDNAGRGAVYIYYHDRESSKWIEGNKLLASDSQEYDFFGAVIDNDGDLIIAGSYGHDDNGTGTGDQTFHERP